MTWFKVDDQLAFHPKVLEAGNGAMGGWLRLGSHCANHETDGFATAKIVRAIFSPDELEAIMATGMLVAHADGRYEMHDYLKYNPSHAELEAKRAAWSAKKLSPERRGVARKASPGEAPGEALVESPKVEREKLVELPGTGSGSGDPDPETRDPEDPGHRASQVRLKPVAPTAEPDGDTGYGAARRIFGEEWAAKFGRPYAWSPRSGPGSDDHAILLIGRFALERGGDRGESFLRHWARGYVRESSPNLEKHGWPARFFTPDVANKYGEPKAAKAPAASPARSPPEVVVSVEEMAKRAAALAQGLGKIGMGGRS